MKAVVISDTHTKHNDIDFSDVGDDVQMIIHCGDFSHSPQQVFSFCKWFEDLDFKYKILIAGNHDEYIQTVGYETFKGYCEQKGIIYLEDTSVEIEGIKFHGSPWSCMFGDWAFMEDDLELEGIAWNKIPDDVQVLITHGPAKGVGDDVGAYQDISNSNVGSSTLAYTINNRLNKLTHHFFGHIHCESGIYTISNSENNYIACNASMSYEWYEKMNGQMKKPYIIEI